MEILLNASPEGEQILLPPGLPAGEQYPHRDYDWEGDGDLSFDLNIDPANDPPQQVESCFACHYGGMAQVPGFPRKRCEDCHVVNQTTGKPAGPYAFYDLGVGEQFTLRQDYDISPLLVSKHLGIKGQRKNSYSSCFDYDQETGEGACHGISITYAKTAGGYFAFNTSPDRRFPFDDPYQRALSSDNLPDTLNCLFCHEQKDSKIRSAWGNPQQIDTPEQIKIHFNTTTNDDCYKCHVNGSIKTFHSEGIYVERIEKEEVAEEGFEEVILGFIRWLIEYLRSLISRWI